MRKRREQTRDGVETRKKMMDMITSYMLKHNYPPSVREIGAAVGLSSTSSVHAQLNNLMKQGKLTMEKAQPRTICVPGIEYVDKREETSSN